MTQVKARKISERALQEGRETKRKSRKRGGVEDKPAVAETAPNKHPRESVRKGKETSFEKEPDAIMRAEGSNQVSHGSQHGEDSDRGSGYDPARPIRSTERDSSIDEADLADGGEENRSSPTQPDSGAEADADGEADAATGPPKRKKRRRAETPDEAEEYELDPTETTMASLTRGSRMGKKSTLEARLQEIDWEEVRRRRREAEENELAKAMKKQEEAEKGIRDEELEHDGSEEEEQEEHQRDDRSEERRSQQGSERGSQRGSEPASERGSDQSIERCSEQSVSQPQSEQATPALGKPSINSQVGLKIVDDQIVIDESTLNVGAVADTAIDAEASAADSDEVVEESDLTRRVNTSSWMHNSRKDPVERVPLANKSHPWSDEQTAQFYDALRMFGTDFFLISKMFPGKTRRQIKLKFVREERSNPRGVNRALLSEQVPIDIAAYGAATGRGEEGYVQDTDEFYEKLEKEKEVQREKIERERWEQEEAARKKKEATLHKEEIKKQKRAERARKRREKMKKQAEKKASKDASQGPDRDEDDGRDPDAEPGQPNDDDGHDYDDDDADGGDGRGPAHATADEGGPCSDYYEAEEWEAAEAEQEFV